MIPAVIVMDAVEELQAFDGILITCQRPEKELDKFLREIYNLLADRSEAPIVFQEYLDRLRYNDLNGEIIGARLEKLFEASYHQLIDSKIYRDNGKLPYVYESRMGYRTILPTYAE
jgi:hypothetical protein